MNGTYFQMHKKITDFYPSLFKSSFHYDILYIISPKSNLCEYIDKREGKWEIIHEYELHDKLFRYHSKSILINLDL